MKSLVECSLIEKLRSPKILDMSVFDWTTYRKMGEYTFTVE